MKLDLCPEWLSRVLNETDRLFLNWNKWQVFLCGTAVCAGSVYFYSTVCYFNSNAGRRRVYHVIRGIPYIRSRIDGELSQVYQDMHKTVHKNDKHMQFQTELPTDGYNKEQLLAAAADRVGLETQDIANGKLSGTVFGDNSDELQCILQQVFSMFAFSNPLHADVFPGARKMEAEVVRMVCSLYNGDEDTCGVVTTGGTESLLLACLAYRNRAHKRGIKYPEMLVDHTQHGPPNLRQGRRLFWHKNPTSGEVNVHNMKKYITNNTCMLVGSAPTFPHGVIDPIGDLAQLGYQYEIPVHVDACFGSFIVPFLEDFRDTDSPDYIRYPVFDFRVPGVTSISCDTHKYGMTPKGTSVLMYRNQSLRHDQFFALTSWPGGVYASSTTGGSKSGCNTALTWATLMYYGQEGYRQAAHRVIQTTQQMTNKLNQLGYLNMIGPGNLCIVSFTSQQLDIYELIDDMATKGWRLNALQEPPGIHFAITQNHVSPGFVDTFVHDIDICARIQLDRGCKLTKPTKTGAMYGMLASMPSNITQEAVFAFLDSCYSTK